jgi:predicted DNA-binding transcriptional regulator AlpA
MPTHQQRAATVRGTVLRFHDLKARGIVRCWPTLLAWIEHENFPTGFQLGPNSRAWLEADVIAWLRSRPVAGAKERQREHADT